MTANHSSFRNNEHRSKDQRRSRVEVAAGKADNHKINRHTGPSSSGSSRRQRGLRRRRRQLSWAAYFGSEARSKQVEIYRAAVSRRSVGPGGRRARAVSRRVNAVKDSGFQRDRSGAASSVFSLSLVRLKQYTPPPGGTTCRCRAPVPTAGASPPAPPRKGSPVARSNVGLRSCVEARASVGAQGQQFQRPAESRAATPQVPSPSSPGAAGRWCGNAATSRRSCRPAPRPEFSWWARLSARSLEVRTSAAQDARGGLRRWLAQARSAGRSARHGKGDAAAVNHPRGLAGNRTWYGQARSDAAEPLFNK